MEIDDEQGRRLEEIIAKGKDPNTTEDEQLELLADILVEGFMWQLEHKDDKMAEPSVSNVKKRRSTGTQDFPKDHRLYL